MNLFNVLNLLLGSGILLPLCTYCIRKIKENDRKTEAVSLGVQALLRDRLYQSYNHYLSKGYAPLYAKENFENMWNQYHNLGANGVMDEIHNKFQNLPTSIKEDSEYEN